MNELWRLPCCHGNNVYHSNEENKHLLFFQKTLWHVWTLKKRVIVTLSKLWRMKWRLCSKLWILYGILERHTNFGNYSQNVAFLKAGQKFNSNNCNKTGSKFITKWWAWIICPVLHWVSRLWWNFNSELSGRISRIQRTCNGKHLLNKFCETFSEYVQEVGKYVDTAEQILKILLLEKLFIILATLPNTHFWNQCCNLIWKKF